MPRGDGTGPAGQGVGAKLIDTVLDVVSNKIHKNK